MNKKELHVYWNNNIENKGRPVESVEEAIEQIREWSKEDDDAGDLITYNSGGLEEKDEDGDYVEYYDEMGRDVMDIIREQDEEEDE